MKQHHLGFLQGARILIILWISLADSHGARADHRNKPGTSMKGAEQLMHLNRPEQALDLKTGDTVAMACSMCKNIAVVRVEKVRGREFLTPGTRHGCAMCGGTVEITGQRMDKHEVIKHTCSQCGEGSAYCCATRRPSKDSSQGESSHQGHSERTAEDHAETKPNQAPPSTEPK